MDKIVIHGLRIFAYHGVDASEKEKGQPFVLNVAMYLSLEKPGHTDRLDDTVNYAAAVKLIKRVMTEEKYDLIEKAAQRTADALLAKFPRIMQIELELQKPRAPIAADFEYVSVCINRERNS